VEASGVRRTASPLYKDAGHAVTADLQRALEEVSNGESRWRLCSPIAKLLIAHFCLFIVFRILSSCRCGI